MRSRHWLVWTAVVLVVGCGSKTQRAGEKGNQSDATARSRVPRVRVPYVIPEAGVHFNPPISWDPDRVQVVTLTGAEAAAKQPGAEYSVSFDYKAEQPSHSNASLLRVNVLKRSQWNRVSSRAAGEVIDSTADWVFVATLPAQDPYRPDLLDADQFKAMQLTMDDVHSAFAIENDGPTEPGLRAESERR